MHLYADDVYLYSHYITENEIEAIKNMNDDIRIINKAIVLFGMQINNHKTIIIENKNKMKD